MLIHPQGERKNLILSIIILLLFVGVTWFIISSYEKRQMENQSPAIPSTRVTLEGNYICLPYKTNGPVTMECALGLRDDGGSYYALDTTLLSPTILMDIHMEQRVHIEGLFVPIDAIRSDLWQKYDITGIVAVTSVSLVN